MTSSFFNHRFYKMLLILLSIFGICHDKLDETVFFSEAIPTVFYYEIKLADKIDYRRTGLSFFEKLQDARKAYITSLLACQNPKDFQALLEKDIRYWSHPRLSISTDQSAQYSVMTRLPFGDRYHLWWVEPSYKRLVPPLPENKQTSYEIREVIHRFSLGAGYRVITAPNWMWGGYVYLDKNVRTQEESICQVLIPYRHMTFSTGGEYITPICQFNINAYKHFGVSHVALKNPCTGLLEPRWGCDVKLSTQGRVGVGIGAYGNFGAIKTYNRAHDVNIYGGLLEGSYQYNRTMYHLRYAYDTLSLHQFSVSWDRYLLDILPKHVYQNPLSIKIERYLGTTDLGSNARNWTMEHVVYRPEYRGLDFLKKAVFNSAFHPESRHAIPISLKQKQILAPIKDLDILATTAEASRVIYEPSSQNIYASSRYIFRDMYEPSRYIFDIFRTRPCIIQSSQWNKTLEAQTLYLPHLYDLYSLFTNLKLLEIYRRAHEENELENINLNAAKRTDPFLVPSPDSNADIKKYTVKNLELLKKFLHHENHYFSRQETDLLKSSADNEIQISEWQALTQKIIMLNNICFINFKKYQEALSKIEMPLDVLDSTSRLMRDSIIASKKNLLPSLLLQMTPANRLSVLWFSRLPIVNPDVMNIDFIALINKMRYLPDHCQVDILKYFVQVEFLGKARLNKSRSLHSQYSKTCHLLIDILKDKRTPLFVDRELYDFWDDKTANFLWQYLQNIDSVSANCLSDYASIPYYYTPSYIPHHLAGYRGIRLEHYLQNIINIDTLGAPIGLTALLI